MSVFKVAIGLGSLIIGAQQIRKGLRHLDEAGRARQLAGTRTRQAPRRGGLHGTPAQMRVHNVRSLDDRIRHIQDRVKKGMVDPQIYAFARKIVSQKCGDKWCIPEKDNLKEMEAIFNAVRRNVRYTSDIYNVDTYQGPGRTLGELRSADCDDFTSLVCSLLLSIGIPCRFKVIRTKDASEWNHIYAQGGLPRAAPTRWYSLDASVDKPFGWEAPASMVAESRIFSALR